MQSELDSLASRVSQLVTLRDELQGRLLISEQMITDMKRREEELNAAMEEQEGAMKDKLDSKEYTLQMYELKIVQYEKYIKKKGMVEGEARNLLYRY